VDQIILICNNATTNTVRAGKNYYRSDLILSYFIGFFKGIVEYSSYTLNNNMPV